MAKTLEQVYTDFQKELSQIKDLKSLNDFEVKYLGRKGELTKILRGLSELSIEQKKKIGNQANQLKSEMEGIIENKRAELENRSYGDLAENEKIDITLPVVKRVGHVHPISQIRIELEKIFKSMGFMVLDGPDLESDWYNFEALNIPEHHPARDMQDTYYIEDNPDLVLRTHTSPMQVRAMQKYGAPLKAIVPGRVFRNEAVDASHEHTFYQIEGLMIDREISISNLIAVMKELLQGIFNQKIGVRLRPGYFPFVEPGFELDISCLICGGKGCSVCKQTGWLELLPCGLVHPKVLEAGGIDPKKWSGFAFGLGLNRLVMMRYGIDDIRCFNSGDLRFLNQF